MLFCTFHQLNCSSVHFITVLLSISSTELFFWPFHNCYAVHFINWTVRLSIPSTERLFCPFHYCYAVHFINWTVMLSISYLFFCSFHQLNCYPVHFTTVLLSIHQLNCYSVQFITVFLSISSTELVTVHSINWTAPHSSALNTTPNLCQEQWYVVCQEPDTHTHTAIEHYPKPLPGAWLDTSLHYFPMQQILNDTSHITALIPNASSTKWHTTALIPSASSTKWYATVLFSLCATIPYWHATALIPSCINNCIRLWTRPVGGHPLLRRGLPLQRFLSCPCQDNPCECEGPLLSEAARETKHCPCQGNLCECEGP